MNIQNLIINYYFYYIAVIVIGLIILLFINGKQIILPLKKIKKHTWLILLLIIVVSFGLRFFYVNHTYQVFWDDMFHKNMALNLQDSNLFCLCVEKIDQVCTNCIYFPKPPFYIIALSWVLKVFGTTDTSGFLFSSTIGVLTSLMFFMFTYIFFKDEKKALWSAFIIAILPVNLRLSGSMSSEILSIFLLLFSFYLLFNYIKNQKILFLGMAILFWTIFIQTRSENFLFIAIFPIVLWLFDKKKNYKKALLVFLILLILNVPFLLFLKEGIGDGTRGWSLSPIEHISMFRSQFIQNIIYWFISITHPVLITLFGILGFITLKKKENVRKFLGYLFLILLLFFSAYESGVFSAGMSIRFSTLLYIPLILLATQGIVWLSNKISKPVWKKVLIIILILYFISTPVINREFLFEEDIRHDAYKFLKEANINPDCTLISYTYVSVLAIVDSNVVSNEYLKEHGPRIDKIVENGGCVLFYMNSDVIKNMDFGDQDIFLKSLEIKYDVEEYLNFKGRDLFLYKLKGIKK